MSGNRTKNHARRECCGAAQKKTILSLACTKGRGDRSSRMNLTLVFRMCITSSSPLLTRNALRSLDVAQQIFTRNLCVRTWLWRGGCDIVSVVGVAPCQVLTPALPFSRATYCCKTLQPMKRICAWLLAKLAPTMAKRQRTRKMYHMQHGSARKAGREHIR